MWAWLLPKLARPTLRPRPTGYPRGLPETAHMNALDQPNHDGERHRMGTSVRDEWQWNTRNRSNSHRHSDVLEGLPQNHGEDACTDEVSEPVLGDAGDAIDAP